MADVTLIQSKRNAGAVAVAVAGAASQTVVYGRSDENISLLIRNTDDTNACRITVAANGNMAGDQGALEVDMALSSDVVIGVLESARFVDPATGKITFEILDQDDSAFTGSESDVLVYVLHAPLSLVD